MSKKNFDLRTASIRAESPCTGIAFSQKNTISALQLEERREKRDERREKRDERRENRLHETKKERQKERRKERKKGKKTKERKDNKEITCFVNFMN